MAPPRFTMYESEIDKVIQKFHIRFLQYIDNVQPKNVFGTSRFYFVFQQYKEILSEYLYFYEARSIKCTNREKNIMLRNSNQIFFLYIIT